MEADSTCSQNAGNKNNVSQGPLAYAGDQTDSSVQHDFTNPMKLPQIAERGMVETSIDDFETKEGSRRMIDILSGIEVEPSLKGSPRTSHGNRSADLKDILAETLVCNRSAAYLSDISFDKSDMLFMTMKYFIVVVSKGSKASENSNSLGSSSLVADMKFTYFATNQNCGNQKRSGDHYATNILKLKVNDPSLCVAHIDEVDEREGGRVQKVYDSVVVKGADNLDQEIYQIKLLKKAKLGERKPEKQTHSLIFTNAEVFQTSDMNQENNMKNCLKELI
ncbi:hypothetical protein GOBAR_DD06412 [Gossypium barbadense]|nr:hypothetical protein GOBAR_DD06412 [Gossypium barbadense]